MISSVSRFITTEQEFRVQILPQVILCNWYDVTLKFTGKNSTEICLCRDSVTQAAKMVHLSAPALPAVHG